ncbi:hypothetical protein LUX09_08560 [Streptomyces albogriseolus]|nr:hypothetical protein [Streptomyces albogriseolus]
MSRHAVAHHSRARTDFESMTHEQLVALLDSASPEGAAQLATKLSKASSTITKIGDDLMTYVKGLEWQGEGGDAFRDWGGQSAAATLRLGQYAEVASRWLSTVAQAVAEAKAAIPATSETTQAKADLAEARRTLAAAQDPGARNDPDTRKLAQTAQSDAAAAQQRMEAARAEAIQQLRKLAQTYEHSAYQVNSVEPPTFSPPGAASGCGGVAEAGPAACGRVGGPDGAYVHRRLRQGRGIHRSDYPNAVGVAHNRLRGQFSTREGAGKATPRRHGDRRRDRAARNSFAHAGVDGTSPALREPAARCWAGSAAAGRTAHAAGPWGRRWSARAAADRADPTSALAPRAGGTGGRAAARSG